MQKLTKADLRQQISRVIGTTRKESREVLDAILDTMVRALRKGERVEIRGFGTFGSHVRQERNSRNPVTGIRRKIGAKRVPHFKQSVVLRALVNGEMEADKEE